MARNSPPANSRDRTDSPPAWCSAPDLERAAMPPLTKPVIDLACVTDPGEVRSQNEDSVGGDADICFAVLADGMGGHNAGEVASRIAADLVSETFRSQTSLHEHLDAR